MAHPILCIEPGSGPFSVDVDMTMTVFQLKQIIKAKSAPALDAVPAAALNLYKINIDVSSDDDYARMEHDIANGVYEFNEQGKLNPWQKVSKYLQQDLGDVIQVLVKLPPAHCTIQDKHIPPAKVPAMSEGLQVAGSATGLK